MVFDPKESEFGLENPYTRPKAGQTGKVEFLDATPSCLMQSTLFGSDRRGSRKPTHKFTVSMCSDPWVFSCLHHLDEKGLLPLFLIIDCWQDVAGDHW